MNLKDIDWKSMIKTAAPMLGSAISTVNPLAGMAVGVLSKALLGKPDGTEEELEDFMRTASPEDLLKLREADNQFKALMKQADVDLEKISAADRNSARKRQIELKDSAPTILAIATVLGFFGTLVFLLTSGVPEGQAGQALLLMLGALTASMVQIFNYYFGSSTGSKKKDDQIKTLIDKG